uniref:CUB domain-containing protein n=1 Tax=Magallana gigas TaxID=29159 RepID=A0A8W8JT69_MAGGI
MFSNNQSINASKNGSCGAFTSPGYPGNYPNNAHYTWTLKTGDSNATVVLNITDFNVVRYRFTRKCEDYLQIERREPYYMQIIKRCGKLTPFNLQGTGNIFVVTFVSDSIHNARGFYLSWKAYLISAIVVIEVILTAIGIYFVKQRRMNFRNNGHEEVNKNTTNPYSSLSRNSGNGNYEVMQLNDVSSDHNLQQTEHNECTYIEIIEHEYDYTYGDIAPASLNIL